MRKGISGNVLRARQWLLEIPENFKAEFTVLLNTLIFVKLIQATHPQFLSVLQNSKIFKIFRLSWIDGTSVNISLAEAQGSPTLHPFPSAVSVNSKLADMTEHLNVHPLGLDPSLTSSVASQDER